MPLSISESAVVSAPRVDCWDCGKPTPIDRDFCRHCGVWLQTSSTGTRSHSGTVPPESDVGTRLDASHRSTSPIGPLPLESSRRTMPGTRSIAATAATLLLALVVGLAAVYVATSPSGENEPSALADAGADVEDGGRHTTSASPRSSVPEEPSPDFEEPPLVVDASTPQVARDEPPVAALAASIEAPISEANTTVGPVAASAVASAPPRLDDPASEGDEPRVVRRRGWVCDGSVRLEDPTDSRWSVSRVSFRVVSGFERVALHLTRAGSDRGDPSAVTAEIVPVARLARRFPNVPRPAAGHNTVVLHLEDGIKATLGLRGYRPDGLTALKEFSAIQSPDGSSRLFVSVAGDGCFRLRAPGWDGGPAQIQLDVRP